VEALLQEKRRKKTSAPLGGRGRPPPISQRKEKSSRVRFRVGALQRELEVARRDSLLKEKVFGVNRGTSGLGRLRWGIGAREKSDLRLGGGAIQDLSLNFKGSSRLRGPAVTSQKKKG